MEWLKYFFTRGPKNTVKLKDGTNFLYSGPWQKLAELPTYTLVDRFYLGEFCAAEYTIVADFDTANREIIKAIVVAGEQKADVTLFGRSNLGQHILDISATVNASYVDVSVRPQQEDSTNMAGAKVFFQATYFKTLNPPR